jgi:hypothetical protein
MRNRPKLRGHFHPGGGPGAVPGGPERCPWRVGAAGPFVPPFGPISNGARK